MTELATPPIRRPSDPVWERVLFTALVSLCVAPIWTVRFFPTTDGPAHVYNAGIILDLLTGLDHVSRFAQYFELHPRPVPNWIGHAVLAVLLTVFPPAAAEKLLVSGYVVLLLGGLRYLVRSVKPGGGWLAFLGLPLVYHWPLQMGFYNFSYGLALFLVAIGFWWRRRAGLTLRGVFGLNAVLLLCYFSHIVPHVLALAAIAVLWLVGVRRRAGRRDTLTVLALAPQLALTLWFVWAQGGRVAQVGDRPFDVTWPYLRRLEVLCTFSGDQIWFGVAVASLFGALIVLTVLKENVCREGGRLRLRCGEVDGFLLLAILLAVVYFVAPDALSGGNLLQGRLSLFPYLALIPWFSARWGKPGTAVILGLLTLATLWNAHVQARWYRLLERETQTFLDGLEAVPRDARIVALLFDRTGPAERVAVLSHTIGYAALERRLLDWDNYEARTNYFPVRFKPTVAPASMMPFYLTPAVVDVRPWRERADYIYAWRMPPDVPVAGSLRRYYRLVTERGGGQLWRSAALGTENGGK